MRTRLAVILVFLFSACVDRSASQKSPQDNVDSILDSLDKLNEILAGTSVALANSKSRLLEEGSGKEKAEMRSHVMDDTCREWFV